MDDIFEISMLLDFYGQLLTSRQYEVIDLHYNSDYSFGEIALLLGISRQGVFDNIKRGKAVLNDYEQKLGLAAKFSGFKADMEEVLTRLGQLDCGKIGSSDKARLDEIRMLIGKAIEKV